MQGEKITNDFRDSFNLEWTEATERLLNSHFDLSKIRLVPIVEDKKKNG